MTKPYPLGLSKSPLSLLIFTLTSSMAPVTFAQDDDAEVLEEVVITGSRIVKQNLVSAAPINQIDAAEIRFQGVVRVEDLLRNVPQIYAAQGTGQSNGATGTTTINLRNLGEERTLVLVNGRRLPAGSPLADGVGADINQIPGALIATTEVLTGGASAVYGSDAIAGVVNFEMKRDFQGLELDFQKSAYHHDNNSSQWSSLLNESGYPDPPGGVTDGHMDAYSVIIGSDLDDGRGNVTAYATYREIDKVLQRDRDYSACSHSTDSSACAGSGTIPEGRVTDFVNFDFVVEGDQFVDNPGITYNYGALNYYQRPDERVTMGAFAFYEINDHVEFYTDMMYMDDRSVSQIAPSGAFFVTDSLFCGNPLLSDQQFEALCGAYGLTEEDFQLAYVGKRNIEGGNRQQDLRHTSHRFTFGFEGEINDTWSYDINMVLSEVDMNNTYYNDLSTTKIRRALDAVADEDGNAVCRSVVDGSDPDCVPWDLFTEGAVTQEQLDYLVLPLFARGTTEQRVATAYIVGDLEDYGWTIPTADTGVSVAFGYETRKESMDFNPDNGYQSGDGAGQGGATTPVSGSYEVDDLFVEAQIPIVEGRSGFESLSLDLSYRRSDYDYDVDADAYGIGLGWGVNENHKLRASYQRAIRGPNIRELFSPQGLNLTDLDADPCGGPLDDDGLTAEGRSFEECARTGVTEEQFGSIPNNPAGQYNYLQGGNTELEPEVADTYTLGYVYTPDYVSDLSVTLDYFSIEIEKGISNLTPEFILNSCLDGIDSQCDFVTRGRSGDLWIGSDLDTSGYITALEDNLAIEKVSGFDLIVDYSISLGDAGLLGFNNVASVFTKWDKQELEGGVVEDCVGGWGSICGSPTADFRNNLRVTWTSNSDIVTTLLWRHIGEIEDLNGNGMDLESVDYFDVAVIWPVLEAVEIRAGVNNLFDVEPPIAGGAAGPSIYGNGNTFPGTYDALGQYMFAGVTLRY